VEVEGGSSFTLTASMLLLLLRRMMQMMMMMMYMMMMVMMWMMLRMQEALIELERGAAGNGQESLLCGVQCQLDFQL
jgi:hypothetical protein